MTPSAKRMCALSAATSAPLPSPLFGRMPASHSACMRLRADCGEMVGVACVPARTETACWHEYIWPVAELNLFVRGRPHFHHAVTGERARANSGAPIALIAYGTECAAKLYASGIDGWMVKP